MEDKILKAMESAGKPVKPAEIAELVKADPKEVSKVIKKMKDQGMVHSPKRCYYAPGSGE